MPWVPEPSPEKRHSSLTYRAALTEHATAELRAAPLCSVADLANELAIAITNVTGRHGLARISLTAALGERLGFEPGTSFDIATACGFVEIHFESAPRAQGVAQL